MKTMQKDDVTIPAGEVTLKGNIYLPPKAKGMVLFAHGSGSGRFSPRNLFVAEALAASGIASLLSDLLNEWEADDRQKVFDIDLLSERLTPWSCLGDERKEAERFSRRPVRCQHRCSCCPQRRSAKTGRGEGCRFSRGTAGSRARVLAARGSPDFTDRWRP